MGRGTFHPLPFRLRVIDRRHTATSVQIRTLPGGAVSGRAPARECTVEANRRTAPKANRSTAMSLDNLEHEEEELADYDIGFQDRLDGKTIDYRLERKLGLGWLRGWRAADESLRTGP